MRILREMVACPERAKRVEEPGSESPAAKTRGVKARLLPLVQDKQDSAYVLPQPQTIGGGPEKGSPPFYFNAVVGIAPGYA